MKQYTFTPLEGTTIKYSRQDDETVIELIESDIERYTEQGVDVSQLCLLLDRIRRTPRASMH